MPVRSLPSKPNLEHLANQAKELQRHARTGDPSALALIGEFHPRPAASADLTRTQAQLTIARLYGFPSWPQLRRHVELIGELTRSPHEAAAIDDLADEFLRLACLTYGADDPARPVQARALLAAHPEIAGATLHTAAAVGNLEAARRLLADHPEQATQQAGPHRWEPLLYLAYSRVQLDDGAPVEVARLLLQHDADPNAGFLWDGNWPPFSALTGAFGRGEDWSNQPPHPACAALTRLLLAAGADPNDGQTLYNRHFRPDDAHLLLLFEHGLGTGDGGPWARRLTPRATTPVEMLEDELAFACANDFADRAELLLGKDVDPDGRGTSHPIHGGRSNYELAHANGGRRICSLLADAGAAIPTSGPVEDLLSALMAGEDPRGASPDQLAAARQRDPAAVKRATELGRPSTIRLLVALGWDVNARQRTTALHSAAWDGRKDLVDLLLELGADPRIVDTGFNATPGGWAEHGGQPALAAYLHDREARAQG